MQWGTLYGRYSDRKRKLAFSTTALAFDTTSPANPNQYRHKTYIARNHALTVSYIFATDGVRISIHFTRKLCYRKDDLAMRPAYGCPENFPDCLTMPLATFCKTFFIAFCSNRHCEYAYKM